MDNSSNDQRYIRLALDEAKKGNGWVSPNPPVGCVVVSKDNKVLATGYHKKLGEAHAEADALNKISDDSTLKDATIYVTLEPCSHEGRTPSCAKRLAKLPIAEVVYGLVDPNPIVSGNGIKILESAGIKTRKSSVLEEELQNTIEQFYFNQTHKQAYLTLKIATSLDGQVALKSGESKWITGEAARYHARNKRGFHDAVLVGAGTLLKDNPTLDLRETPMASKEFKLIIYDPKDKIKKIDGSFNVSKAFDQNAIYFIKPKGSQQLGPNALIPDNFLNLRKNLFELGVYSVFAEGGSYLHSQLLQEKCVNSLLLYMAPKVIGSKNGVSWTGDLAINKLTEAINFSTIKTEHIGSDILLTARL